MYTSIYILSLGFGDEELISDCLFQVQDPFFFLLMNV
jgi:hypothetical protein